MHAQIDLRVLFTVFGFIFAIISFFYKNHETNQLRIFKNISDHIKEINKICIEVFSKKELDEGVYHKVAMYLDLVFLDVKTFPTGKFYKCKICREMNKDIVNLLIEEYKDLIFSDTPIENKSLKIEDYPDPELRLVKIIQKSVTILETLESHLP